MSDELLTAGEIFEDLDGRPLAITESRVVIPKKGKLLNEDGEMKIAIIRPCISRGKRIKGHRPIYEPKMLERNAEIFSNSPMYMDHMIAEALEEMADDLKGVSEELYTALQERARTIRELGGRITKSWWDPSITFEDDEEYGYRPGGVVGMCIPQPEPQKMLEADPGILQCSINAFLSGARLGTASWDVGSKGAIVEGIRKEPRPSVDWVFRGGAGGRPLLSESEEFREAAVSVLEAAYTSGTADVNPPKRKKKEQMGDKTKKLSEMSLDELKEHLEAEGASDLAEQIKPAAETPPAPSNGNSAPLSREDVGTMIKEGLAQFGESVTEKLEESTASVEERAEQLVEAREEARGYERVADKLLKEAVDNGFPDSLAAEIRGRYQVLPSGATPGLRVGESDLTAEEDGKTVTLTAEKVVENRVRADVDHGIKVLREAGADPEVKGFGASEGDPNGESEEGDKDKTEKPSALEAYADRHGARPTDLKASEKEKEKV